MSSLHPSKRRCATESHVAFCDNLVRMSGENVRPIGAFLPQSDITPCRGKGPVQLPLHMRAKPTEWLMSDVLASKVICPHIQLALSHLSIVKIASTFLQLKCSI